MELPMPDGVIPCIESLAIRDRQPIIGRDGLESEWEPGVLIPEEEEYNNKNVIDKDINHIKDASNFDYNFDEDVPDIQEEGELDGLQQDEMNVANGNKMDNTDYKEQFDGDNKPNLVHPDDNQFLQ